MAQVGCHSLWEPTSSLPWLSVSTIRRKGRFALKGLLKETLSLLLEYSWRKMHRIYPFCRRRSIHTRIIRPLDFRIWNSSGEDTFALWVGQQSQQRFLYKVLKIYCMKYWQTLGEFCLLCSFLIDNCVSFPLTPTICQGAWRKCFLCFIVSSTI